MALTKFQLFDIIKNRLGFARKQSESLIEIPLDTVKGSFESIDDVMISDIGKFSIKKKKQRKGRNPATG